MTVSSSYIPKTYKPGAGSSAEAIGYEYRDPSDLIVTHIAADTGLQTVLVRDLDYAIGGDGPAGTGTVRALADWPVDDDFRVERRTLRSQSARLSADVKLATADIEGQLDKAAMGQQEQDYEVVRAARVPHGEVGPSLASTVGQAGKMVVVLDDNPAAPAFGYAANDPAAAESAATRSETALALVLVAKADTAQLLSDTEAVKAATDALAAATQGYRDQALGYRDDAEGYALAALAAERIYDTTGAGVAAHGTDGDLWWLKDSDGLHLYKTVSAAAVDQSFRIAPGATADAIDEVDADLLDYAPQRMGAPGQVQYVANPTNGRTWRPPTTAAATSSLESVEVWARASGNITLVVENADGSVAGSLVQAVTGDQENIIHTPNLPPVPVGGRPLIYDAANILSSNTHGGGGAWEYKAGLYAGGGGWSASTARIMAAFNLRAYDTQRKATAEQVKATEDALATEQAYRAEVVASLKKWQALAGTTTTGFYIDQYGAKVASGAFRYHVVNVTGREDALRIASGTTAIGSGLYAVTYYDAEDGPDGSGSKIGDEYPGPGTQTFTNSALNPPPRTRSIVLTQGTANGAFAVQAEKIATDHESRIAALEATGGAGGSILFTGDSTSESSGLGVGDELAALYPTRTVYTEGVGGRQWRNNIRHRLGIAETYITITGGVVPKTGTAACTFTDSEGGAIGPWAHNSYNVIGEILVLGARCKVTYVQASGTYTIEALDTLPTGGLAVPDESLVKVTSGIIVESGGPGTGVIADAPQLVDMLKGTVILRTVPSINDLIGSATSAAAFDTFVGYIDSAIEYLSRFTSKIALVGLMTGEALLDTAQGGTFGWTEAQAYERLNAIRYLNAYMASRAPLFIDPLANHKAAGDTTPFTVNGVSFDILVNTADKLHESAGQQTRTAALIDAARAGAGW